MGSCIFCAIVAGDAPSFGVYEDQHAVAFMDINPAVEGHTLVVPRAHAVDLLDIDPDVAGRVMAAAVRVSGMLSRALQTDGINMVHASGAAAWQSVFHFHLHLMPRWRGDTVPFWGLMLGRGETRDRLAEISGRIRAAG